VQRDITERKKAEDKLLEDQAKLKAMASEMLLTEEHERQRLAVGLHDSVCQKLVLTKLALESSLNLVSDSKVLASLRIVCEGIGETIEQADSLTFELSNPVLRQLGFVIALEKYLTEEIRQKHGIVFELQSDEQLSTLPDEIKNCLFRVTRELLTNVVKHAQARKVMVSVRESQSQIYVRVQDDGVGFKESQVSATVSQTARFGLFSIREQLEYLGGHLEIESEPGQGTTATVVVPLTKNAIV
jgi:signal transduction histidine kinase